MHTRPPLPLLLVTVALAAGAARAEPAYRCPDAEPLRRPYFGDLHVHTALSLDAGTQQTRTRPAEAYRFARGEELGIQPFDAAGRPLRRTRLARPLDFAAVTDHAELLGEVRICTTPGHPGHDSWVCRMYRGLPRLAFFYMNTLSATGRRHDFCGENGSVCREAAREPWREIRRAAAEAYEPCAFTTFAGYEWTGARGLGVNFHRNVIFSGERVPALPISYIEAPTPPELWAELRAGCRDAGDCDAVVIPHNTNLGAGEMFPTRDAAGEAIGVEQARERAAFERLVEVMQHKGDSECAPQAGAEDELCGFEKLPYASFRGRFVGADRAPARAFVRQVLKEGLAERRRLGVNPFGFGLVASTDTHLGTPGLVAENADFPGHGGAGNPVGDAPPAGLPDRLEFNPGGLAVLWAEENTREALFAAMLRREAYGTSGPRIELRFFGGWSLPADLCQADVAAGGYAGGVPMGGVLPAPAPPGAPPIFVVSALRDPAGAGTRLERLQIVKGWLEGDEPRERVLDVAGTPGAASVDLVTCTTEGPGADQLCAVWRDPDFDPETPAFYYARAVENPTCRWSQQLCVARGVRCDEPARVPEELEACCAAEHRPRVQERAWSSPIWYEP